ncbi:hypothetical protein IQ229_13640 [Nostoc cf. edaphicum LEGE 07299]|uniref:Uncharacterized protein n=1 Tax=Nostoc cf. edaphicum LEGE 07299 TaxID=2777974 RepID=A0ABR9TZW8_9NOSO|nr:hypothetical protein [Nostoc edaphicum]MBE9105941.1 hypothetical protein [Nostoc cf. edaphicum LEGE 07299]
MKIGYSSDVTDIEWEIIEPIYELWANPEHLDDYLIGIAGTNKVRRWNRNDVCKGKTLESKVAIGTLDELSFGIQSEQTAIAKETRKFAKELGITP